MQLKAGTLILALLLSPIMLHGKELSCQGLSRIERNSNANIIQYDAQIGNDGKLDSRNPMVGYWIRLAEEGQVKQLSFVQKKLACGFKARYNARENTAEIT